MIKTHWICSLTVTLFLIMFIISCKKDKPATIPDVSTTEPSIITDTIAISGGNITSDGSSAIIARGVCWFTKANPTTANTKTTDSIGVGRFTSKISRLKAGTTYHLRAYATNSVGTAYGADISITTNVTLPIVTTTIASAITATSVSSGGNITSDGGDAITARGVCWATSQNPSIMDSKSTDGTGAGSYLSSISGLSAGTTYHLRAYATNSLGTSYGADISFTTNVTLPILSTTIVSAITETTVSSGGNITSDGGAAITARGVCWAISQNPSITDSKSNNGTGAGSFGSSISGLSPGVTYHIRAYATNSAGTAYGNELSFTCIMSATVTDIDGNIYHKVTIGTQVWLKENLSVTKYQNGNLIGTTNPATLDISAESTPKYQWAYDGNESNVPTCGRLYTWYAITDSRGVCPVGWHVPSSNEWYAMSDYLLTNGYNYDGSTTGNISMNNNRIAKALATSTGWAADNTNGAVGNTDYSSVRNITGFSALPGGLRNLNGIFSNVGKTAIWWNSTVYNLVGTAFIEYMNYNYNYVTWGYDDKKSGFSIRCLKN